MKGGKHGNSGSHVEALQRRRSSRKNPYDLSESYPKLITALHKIGKHHGVMLEINTEHCSVSGLENLSFNIKISGRDVDGFVAVVGEKVKAVIGADLQNFKQNIDHFADAYNEPLNELQRANYLAQYMGELRASANNILDFDLEPDSVCNLARSLNRVQKQEAAEIGAKIIPGNFTAPKPESGQQDFHQQRVAARMDDGAVPQL